MIAVAHSPEPAAPRHVPVLASEVLAALAPRDGETLIDATFGGGGYTRLILEAAQCRVIALDRDPDAISGGKPLANAMGGRLTLVEAEFADVTSVMQDLGLAHADGVVFDIGVSSLQIDEAERGFSFMRDGPLDMRMSKSGPSAADYVNALGVDELADLIFVFGEEPRSRAIARAIDAARAEAPIVSTLALVRAVERATGPQRAHERIHPATRTFQALRIHVNGELDQLARALVAAESLLAPGGRLVAVTFHSLEDRIVKHFLAERSGHVPAPSRHAPVVPEVPPPTFILQRKSHVEASAEEIARNPRARSAKLRAAIRTSAPARANLPETPHLPQSRGRRH